MRRLSRWFMAALTLAALAALAWSLTGGFRAALDPRVVVVLSIGALYGLHRLLIWAEGRGWVYYRKGRGSYGGFGVASEFLNMYDPSRKYIQETVRKRDWERDEDDDGDGPSGGNGTSRRRREISDRRLKIAD